VALVRVLSHNARLLGALCCELKRLFFPICCALAGVWGDTENQQR